MARDAVGALISIIASAISIFGVNIQKYAHSQVASTDHKNYLKMPVWWLGMSGVVLGAIGDFVAPPWAIYSKNIVILKAQFREYAYNTKTLTRSLRRD